MATAPMDTQDWLASPSVNYGNTSTDYGSTATGGAKPWYQNVDWAGAITGSVNGIMGYLTQQENLRGQRALQNDRFNFETNMTNAAVNRASTMPLLQRYTKPKK